MSALLQAPETDGELDGNAADRKLVAAVRGGDDRAFEELYERYHRRIHAYVFGMVKDHQRAEDVTQEVFMSAVRRMRATERPIAFKPWIYEIAKNACIDQFRRSKRAEEVSFDADDGLAPSDYGRLVSAEPVPDAALLAKQKLDDLCGAFGGLSDAHHQILVLRELEGLSYREIGERMGMSRPAVESTLFRARRRLTEEYDELASGQRCLRIQSIIAGASTAGRLGARDTRRLARHVAHCQPCRREALAAGVDSALLAHRPMRERVAAKVAALFPFPLLKLQQLPFFGDQAAGGAKAAAAAAIVIAGLGVGTQVAPQGGGDGRDGASTQPAKAAAQRVSAPVTSRAPSAAPAALVSGVGERVAGTKKKSGPAGAKVKAGKRAHGGRGIARRGAGSGGAGTGGDAPAGGGGSTTAAPDSGSGGGSSGSSPRSGSRSGSGGVKLPAVTKPVQDAPDTVNQVTDQVTDTVDEVTSGATAPVTGAVDDTVQGVTGTVGGAVDDPVGTVGDAVQDPGGTVGGVVGGATGGVLP